LDKVTRQMVAIFAAAMLAAIPSLAARRQAADKFKAGCALPFFGIQDHHSIDSVCVNPGEPNATEGAVAENEEQNRTKNNFCAIGTAAMVTRKTFEALQKRTDRLKADTASSATPFTYGSHQTLPHDRAAIRESSFYTTTEGDQVHEGHACPDGRLPPAWRRAFRRGFAGICGYAEKTLAPDATQDQDHEHAPGTWHSELPLRRRLDLRGASGTPLAA
jgi:hypothetical protein